MWSSDFVIQRCTAMSFVEKAKKKAALPDMSRSFYVVVVCSQGPVPIGSRLKVLEDIKFLSLVWK
jgi:hypothetical protein